MFLELRRLKEDDKVQTRLGYTASIKSKINNEKIRSET